MTRGKKNNGNVWFLRHNHSRTSYSIFFWFKDNVKIQTHGPFLAETGWGFFTFRMILFVCFCFYWRANRTWRNLCPLTWLKPGMLWSQSHQLKPRGHKNVPVYIHICLPYQDWLQFFFFFYLWDLLSPYYSVTDLSSFICVCLSTVSVSLCLSLLWLKPSWMYFPCPIVWSCL